MNPHLQFKFEVNKENNSIHIQREFAAGLQLVWNAWTTPELQSLIKRKRNPWIFAKEVPGSMLWWDLTTRPIGARLIINI